MESVTVERSRGCLEKGSDVNCSDDMISGDFASSAIDVNTAVSGSSEVIEVLAFDVATANTLGSSVEKRYGDFSVILEGSVVCPETMKLSSVDDCVTISDISGNEDGFCVIKTGTSAVQPTPPII